MLPLEWYQTISRNINWLASTAFPQIAAKRLELRSTRYTSSIHIRVLKDKADCSLLSFPIDFVKEFVHFCQSHDEMSAMLSWTHQVFKETNWPHCRRHFSPGKDYRKRVVFDTESLQLYKASLWESGGNNLRLQKIASYSSHLCTLLKILEVLNRIDLNCTSRKVPMHQHAGCISVSVYQCISAVSAWTFEPNKFLRKRLAAWEFALQKTQKHLTTKKSLAVLQCCLLDFSPGSLNRPKPLPIFTATKPCHIPTKNVRADSQGVNS